MSTVTKFVFRPERAQAYGKPLSDGRFLVFKGSTAMRYGSPPVKRDTATREELIAKGVLASTTDPDLLVFTVDYEFTSASKAAGIVKDGNASGPGLWRDDTTGLSLKQFLERQVSSRPTT